MPRIMPLLTLVCVCWIASASGSASAQPVTLPNCDRSAAAKEVAAGAIPDLVGCSPKELGYFLPRVRQLHRAWTKPDGTASGIQAGFVTRQELKDGQVTYFISTGQGYPPAAPATPATQICPDGTKVPASETCPDKSQSEQPQQEAPPNTTSNPQPPPAPLPPPAIAQGAPPPIVAPVPTNSQSKPDPTAKPNPPTPIPAFPAIDQTPVAVLPQPAPVPTVETVDARANTYTIVAPTSAARGRVLSFRVERTGPASPSDLNYEFRQGKDLISPDGLSHPLHFAQGETRKTLELSGDRYAKCGLPPTVMQVGPAGSNAQATASFSSNRCTLLERLTERGPWWPVAAGLLMLGGIAYAIWKIWFPVKPALYPTWDIQSEPLPAAFSAPRIPGWPRFSAHVEIEWGGAIVPEPLPIVEKKDG